jgi:hypothetical protein
MGAIERLRLPEQLATHAPAVASRLRGVLEAAEPVDGWAGGAAMPWVVGTDAQERAAAALANYEGFAEYLQQL